MKRWATSLCLRGASRDVLSVRSSFRLWRAGRLAKKSSSRFCLELGVSVLSGKRTDGGEQCVRRRSRRHCGGPSEVSRIARAVHRALPQPPSRTTFPIEIERRGEWQPEPNQTVSPTIRAKTATIAIPHRTGCRVRKQSIILMVPRVTCPQMLSDESTNVRPDWTHLLEATSRCKQDR
jgi:hypothetical protein